METLGTNIVNGIKTFMESLFVPNSDEMESSISDIRNNFSFVDDIKNAQQDLFSVFNETKTRTFSSRGNAPSFVVDFGSARSFFGFNYGGEILIDFAWYEPYKPTVDAIISAFAWGFFLFNIFRKLPSIISGSSATISSVADMENNRKE